MEKQDAADETTDQQQQQQPHHPQDQQQHTLSQEHFAQSTADDKGNAMPSWTFNVKLHY